MSSPIHPENPPHSNLAAVIAQLRAENAVLRAEVRAMHAQAEKMQAASAKALAENEKLRAENKLLRAEVDELKRGQHRPAAPFSKNSPKKNPRKPGRKPGQGVFRRRSAPEDASGAPAQDVPVDACACPHCGGPLDDEEPELVSIVDIPPPPPPDVLRLRMGRKRCRKCGRIVRATHPKVPPDQRGATAHRVGPRLKAAALSLHYGSGVPQQRVPSILRALAGLSLTQGALTQSALHLARRQGAAGMAAEQIRRSVSQAPVVYTDDTGWRTGGKNSYLMTFVTGLATFYQVREHHRNQEVREVVPADYQGVMKTDRGSSYDARELAGVRQDKCVCHLLRSVQVAMEGQGPGARSLSRALEDALRRANGLWKAFKAGDVDEGDFARRGAGIKALLMRLLRPRPLKDKANRKLVSELGWHARAGHLLGFLDDPRVEPTNNRAERALRPGVIARKVSQCSKTQAGADAFCAFKSLIATMASNGIDMLEGMAQITAGINPLERLLPAAPD